MVHCISAGAMCQVNKTMTASTFMD